MAGSDGHIVIYGRKDNTYYHTLKIHTKTILDFDIHSTGRLLVSYGIDGKLKLTDLAEMSEVYHKNLKQRKLLLYQLEIDFLRFAPDNNLLFTIGRKLMLFNSDDNSMTTIKELGAKITCIHVESSLVILSDEKGAVHFAMYPTMALFSFQAYASNRVKAFKYLHEEGMMVTISTEGFVTVWDVSMIIERVNDIIGDIDLHDKIESLYSFEIESRLICVDARVSVKRATQADDQSRKGVVKNKKMASNPEEEEDDGVDMEEIMGL